MSSQGNGDSHHRNPDPKMRKTVAVALSGGLDSAVAAAFLKKGNYQVIGVYFQTGYEFSPANSGTGKGVTCGKTLAEQVAEQIGIPLEVFDCSRHFRREVVNYFIDTYHSGQTPNPCVVCNKRIKFGYVMEKAMALGASALATGHYCRIKRKANGEFWLLKGIDPAKDQSYFLARLGQDQLSHALFPLGDYTKNQVREMAKTWGFRFLMKKESQQLCFIRHESYKDFLSRRMQSQGTAGPIVNTRGEVLGRHHGLHTYTIGQRRGIGIPGPQPYYVIRLDMSGNRLVIGFRDELAATECEVKSINWTTIRTPDEPISARTRIRYRHKEADSIITPAGRKTAIVRFSEPQYAITPGQAAVFYQGDRVLGGGWIA